MSLKLAEMERFMNMLIWNSADLRVTKSDIVLYANHHSFSQLLSSLISSWITHSAAHGLLSIYLTRSLFFSHSFLLSILCKPLFGTRIKYSVSPVKCVCLVVAFYICRNKEFIYMIWHQNVLQNLNIINSYRLWCVVVCTRKNA